MKLTMLGTGHALVTECYNTCFVLSEKEQYFLVDGGGGNGILKQLQLAKIDWKKIKTIFVTHKHIDHVTGIFWMMRMVCQNMAKGEYEGQVTIYAHEELTNVLKNIAYMLLQEKETKFIGNRLRLIELSDKDEYEIIGHKTVFFDIQSDKAKQYGFTMYMNNDEKLTCCGDEPYRECEREYALNSTWLLHEAFCLYSQKEMFKPYEKNHSTVKDACQLAERLHIENLLLYHTEDINIERRKELYGAEGVQYFSGKLYIPDDLETIEL